MDTLLARVFRESFLEEVVPNRFFQDEEELTGGGGKQVGRTFQAQKKVKKKGMEDRIAMRV